MNTKSRTLGDIDVSVPSTPNFRADLSPVPSPRIDANSYLGQGGYVLRDGVCNVVCLRCEQLHAKTAELLLQILPHLRARTRKTSLNFGRHSDVDSDLGVFLKEFLLFSNTKSFVQSDLAFIMLFVLLLFKFS